MCALLRSYHMDQRSGSGESECAAQEGSDGLATTNPRCQLKGEAVEISALHEFLLAGDVVEGAEDYQTCQAGGGRHAGDPDGIPLHRGDQSGDSGRGLGLR